MKIINILLVITLLPFSAFAQKTEFETLTESMSPKCDKDVTYLVYQEKVPCNGYLFSPKKEYEIRFKIETYDYMEKFVEGQSEMVNVLQQRVDLAQKQNLYLAERVQDLKSDSFWEKTIYFALGAVLTGVIATNVR